MKNRPEDRQHRFYGWQTADITDALGLTPRDYYDLLSRVWCRETCAARMRNEWSEGNKTWGQCTITAFLMQDIYGGRVYGVKLPDGNYHSFNVVGDCAFDLTSEQFGDHPPIFSDLCEQSRETHFAKEEKRLRYELLKAKLAALLPQKEKREETQMEEQIVTVTIRTKGEKCEMTDDAIREWYATHVAKLFNPAYGTPEIEVDVKRIVK